MKCEPEYTHSKIFKVSTAIINFYLPLLVLISLNGRIYYEIKRRYKDALLQRNSNRLNLLSNNHKLNITMKYSCIPIIMTIYDSDGRLYSTPINLTENDTLTMAKRLPTKNENNSTLHINFKENNYQSTVQKQISNHRRISSSRRYSLMENNDCPQVNINIKYHNNNVFVLLPIGSIYMFVE